MSKPLQKFLRDLFAGDHEKRVAPRCPQCMRLNQRSLVSISGHVRIRAGALEVTRGNQTTVAKGRRVETITYRCSNGHGWTETDSRELP